MKTRLNSKVAGIVLLMGLSVGMMQCEKQAIAEPTVEFQNLEARGGLDPATLCACLTENYATDALSDDEITALQFMRQEEKMARDVYFAMNERYDQKVFANIIRAEQQHMDAINCLLDKCRLADPVLGLGYGEFADAGLVKWYGELIEKGNKSLADAWQVGATIEDLDIADLESWLAKASLDNADVKAVFGELMRGSRNHLRAFVRNLGWIGISYDVQYLNEDIYQSIIETTTERGSGMLCPALCDGSGLGKGIGRGQGNGTCDGTGLGTGKNNRQGNRGSSNNGNGRNG